MKEKNFLKNNGIQLSKSNSIRKMMKLNWSKKMKNDLDKLKPKEEKKEKEKQLKAKQEEEKK